MAGFNAHAQAVSGRGAWLERMEFKFRACAVAHEITFPRPPLPIFVSTMKYVLIICTGLGAIMLFLLATAGANTDFFEHRYKILLFINIVFVLLFMVVVGFLLWRFRRRLKSGVFGSRLALRLLLIFSLMAILPGALIYTVSVQFLGKSIESWFDVKVDRALEGGINLGQTMLKNLLDDLQKKA